MTSPNQQYYVREITRKVDEQINSVRRELANLLNVGILTSKNKNNRLYYEVNQNFEHYDALRQMFAHVSEEGKVSADDGMKSQFKEMGAVKVLAYLGSFTNDSVTGVDVLIIGDVNKTAVEHFIHDLEQKEKRELAYAVMKESEFKYRRDVNDRFITMVDSAKKNIIHDPDGLMK